MRLELLLSDDGEFILEGWLIAIYQLPAAVRACAAGESTERAILLRAVALRYNRKYCTSAALKKYPVWFAVWLIRSDEFDCMDSVSVGAGTLTDI